MSNKPSSPKNEKEELLYYKGIHLFRQLVVKRAAKMEEIAQIDQDIAKVVSNFKSFVGWRELGEILGMSDQQARNYLMPLMEEIEK